LTWVHWVLYNIPATISFLPEGLKGKDLPKGTLQGLNDWKKSDYISENSCEGKDRQLY